MTPCRKCGAPRVAYNDAGKPGAFRYACRPCERARVQAHRVKNPDRGVSSLQRRAHKAVENALIRGTLHRNPCMVCGTQDRVQAHHEDYSRPLDVVWLCPTHHKARHREMRCNAA
jgi:hypothetical protein